MHFQLWLHQPLKAKLKEFGIASDAKTIKSALPVVDFQSPPLCCVPVGADLPAVELTAGNRAVVQISIRDPESEFPGAVASTLDAKRSVRRDFEEEPAAPEIGSTLSGQDPACGQVPSCELRVSGLRRRHFGFQILTLE